MRRTRLARYKGKDRSGRSVVSLTDPILRGLNELGLIASTQQVDRFSRYLEMLGEWNQTYNLTAVRDPARMVTHHLLDSLAVLGYCQGDQLMDLGSGAGLPGIPLAIQRPEWQFRLVDSNGKKTRFLQHVVRQLSLVNVTVERERGETIDGSFNTIVVRAFGSLRRIAAVCEPRLAHGGLVVAMKAQLSDDELGEFRAADSGLSMVEPSYLEVPGVAGVRSVVLLSRSESGRD